MRRLFSAVVLERHTLLCFKVYSRFVAKNYLLFVWGVMYALISFVFIR